MARKALDPPSKTQLNRILYGVHQNGPAKFPKAYCNFFNWIKKMVKVIITWSRLPFGLQG